MRGSDFSQLTAFMAVAERRSFVKAATQLGMAPSTLSQTIAALEERLGVRLLNRTTRSVAPTPAGEELLAQLRPALQAFDNALGSVDRFRDRTAGNLRIVMSRAAGVLIMAPLVADFMALYPGITLELVVDDDINDIVQQRFDAGVRIGHLVERDMTALPLSPAVPIRVVAAPAFLARHPPPATPRELQPSLCIRTCHAVTGAPFRWQFERQGQHLELMPAGALSVNDERFALAAAVAGAGIALLLGRDVDPYLADGRLVSLLEDWTTELPPFYLFYPRNHHPPPPLRAFIDFVKEAATR